MLTAVVVRTVLPIGNPPGVVVAVRVGVRVGVLLAPGEVAVRVADAVGDKVGVRVSDAVGLTVVVGVSDAVGLTVVVRVGVAVPITVTYSEATQPLPNGVSTGM
jgi:hypothetical protein